MYLAMHGTLTGATLVCARRASLMVHAARDGAIWA